MLTYNTRDDRYQKKLSNVLEQTECEICFMPIVYAHTLLCKHSFCYLCWRDWDSKLRSQKEVVKCPVCRRTVTRAPQPCIKLDQMIECILAAQSDQSEIEEWRKRRDECLEVMKKEKMQTNEKISGMKKCVDLT